MVDFKNHQWENVAFAKNKAAMTGQWFIDQENVNMFQRIRQGFMTGLDGFIDGEGTNWLIVRIHVYFHTCQVWKVSFAGKIFRDSLY